MHLEPRIRSIRATGETPSPKGFSCVARFDVELGEQVTLHGLRLVRTPSGRHEVYPPDTQTGGRSASLAPAFRTDLASLAAAHLGDVLGADSANRS